MFKYQPVSSTRVLMHQHTHTQCPPPTVVSVPPRRADSRLSGRDLSAHPADVRRADSPSQSRETARPPQGMLGRDGLLPERLPSVGTQGGGRAAVFPLKASNKALLCLFCFSKKMRFMATFKQQPVSLVPFRLY